MKSNNNLPSFFMQSNPIFKTGFAILILSMVMFGCKDKHTDPPKPETPSDNVSVTFKFSSLLGPYFTSNAGDTIRIAKLKFLFSNFILEKTTGEFVKIPDAYGFLSLTEKIDSFVITNVPKGDYKSLRLEVGIDSAINHANPQQWGLNHPLNPSVNDMFWSWSGGYIFNVIEGYYQNNGFEKAFSFHVALDKNARKYGFITNFSITKNGRFNMNVSAEKYFSNAINFSLKKDGDFSHSGDPDPVMDKFIQNVGTIDFVSYQ